MRSTRILLVAGVLVWAMAGVTVAQDFFRSSGLWPWAQAAAWLIFGVAFIAGAGIGAVDFRAALWVQILTANVLVWAPGGNGIEIALLVMVAGQLPAAFSLNASLLWVGAQTLAAILPEVLERGLAIAALGKVPYLAFQLFAVGAAGLAESERRASEALARANSALESLQEELAATSREAERLRIARELHDSLGHHLTVLGLDLEAARHLASGEALAPVQRARDLASSLITELRQAVAELREDAAEDLASRLHSLARADGPLRVDVDVDESARETPRAVAAAMTRVAQELVTNTTKHARASLLTLVWRGAGDFWTLSARDNGVGAERPCPGHGLSGMRERVEGLGGVLDIVTSPGRGFTATATIPRSARP